MQTSPTNTGAATTVPVGGGSPGSARGQAVPDYARCWVEIDLGALRHNARVAADLAGHPVMAVVKANGYGHGAEAVARALEGEPSVAGFGVAGVAEGLALRRAGAGSPVFVLGACLPEERAVAVGQGFNVIVSDLEEAAAFDAAALAQGTTAAVHLAIDTGMGRLGLLEKDWSEAWMARLLELRNLQLAGVASHLPSADEDEAFTLDQAQRFRRLAARVRAAADVRQVHLCNSAGIMAMGDRVADFCNLSRAGLMLYGVAPVPRHAGRLRPVLSWHTRVTLVRELPPGHGISYGRTLVTDRPTRVATLGIGYGDGYPRHLSGNGATVLVHGVRCPLLGRVTMDQVMVDVGAVGRPVLPGDPAVLLGGEGAARIDAAELARHAGTIPWEILTGISRRVARVYRPAG